VKYGKEERVIHVQSCVADSAPAKFKILHVYVSLSCQSCDDAALLYCVPSIVCHQTHGGNSVTVIYLNWTSKLFHRFKENSVPNKNHIIFSTTPYARSRISLRKLTVRIIGVPCFSAVMQPHQVN